MSSDNDAQTAGISESPLTRDRVWADYRFSDPEWLTWWLGSLHMLPPIQQLEVADRLRVTLYTPDVQIVLDEFIEDIHLNFGLGSGAKPSQGTQVPVPTSMWNRQEEPEGETGHWLQVSMERLLRRFKPVLLMFVILLGMALFGAFLPAE